ncbi:MAG: hypothetical protein RIQ89_2382 [Bacteroidota bacterium]|jgi:signal transduction histidine kinase
MKPVTIFSILLIYIIAQYGWWAYLLSDLNKEVHEQRIEIAKLKINEKEPTLLIQDLRHKSNTRQKMIYGEGAVFLSLLFIGAFFTYRSFNKEVALAKQQKNFLLSVTHEFKSPIAAVKLYLQTLQRHNIDEEKKQAFLASAVRDTDRLDQLVENTLLANTIDHKGFIYKKDKLNLSALIRLIVTKYHQNPSFKHQFNFSLNDEIEIIVDKSAFILAISNLIENAIKYSNTETNIKISTEVDRYFVKINIADQGIGIPSKERKNIFKKFYRIGNEETRTTKGTGLGLFIVKHIINAHNGEITVSDNIPKGTIFTISLHNVSV